MPLTRIFKADFSPKLNEIRLFTAIVSFLFSFIAFGVDELINSDGVLYMNMARAFLDEGLLGSAQLFNWPFFSILVSGFHLFTGFSLETSGELVNIILFVLFTDAFDPDLLKNFTQQSTTFYSRIIYSWLHTAQRLQGLSVQRYGLLGFYCLWSLRVYPFFRKPSWLLAFAWQVAVFLSILFRIEGVVILLALPFFLLGTNQNLKTAFQQIAMLWSTVIVFTAIAISIALSQTSFVIAFSKISEVLTYIDFPTLINNFLAKSEIINSQVMSNFDKDSGSLILASGLLVMMLEKIFTALSIPYIIFYIYTRYSKYGEFNSEANYRKLILFFVAINFLILLIFVFKQYFLSTRYAVMLITGLFILMLPRICQFVENAWQHKRKGILAFTVLVLIAGPIDSFTVSVSKAYIKDVAMWAADNLPDDSSVITFDVISHYYIHDKAPEIDITLDTKGNLQNIKNYDYLVLVIKRRNSELAEKLTLKDFEIIYKTANSRGDRALVLRNQQQDS
ncbi:hypothetical protein, partial [Methylophaga muralis]|uniref:hypothetical protein n=1 Tax=Methylophaga muralis TaxID=291169 RepID=UPI000845F4C1